MRKYPIFGDGKRINKNERTSVKVIKGSGGELKLTAANRELKFTAADRELKFTAAAKNICKTIK